MLRFNSLILGLLSGFQISLSALTPAFADDCILLTSLNDTYGSYCCKYDGEIKRECFQGEVQTCRVGITAGIAKHCKHLEVHQSALITTGNGLTAAALINQFEKKLNDANHLIEKNRFNTERDLSDYALTFSLDFLNHLNTLNSNATWLDSGAGECKAVFGIFDPSSSTKNLEKKKEAIRSLADLYDPFLIAELNQQLHTLQNSLAAIQQKEPSTKPNVIGVTFKMDGPIPTDNSKIKVLTGRFLEAIPNHEIGTVDLVTDLYGVLAYTHSLDVALQKYLTLLSPSGVIYFETGSSPTQSHTEIRTRSGQRVSLIEWLSTNPTLKVEFVKVDPSLLEREPNYIIKIKKKEGIEPKIPALTLTEIQAMAPPRRVFTEK